MPPNTPRHLINTRKITPKQTLNAPPIAQKALTLSRKVNECKPLPRASLNASCATHSPDPVAAAPRLTQTPTARGLHSSTSQLEPFLREKHTLDTPNTPNLPLNSPEPE